MSLFVGLVCFVIIVKVFLRLTVGRCTNSACLVGKTALVTGGNSGIGFQTALALAGRGCRVIIADKDDCSRSLKEIKEKTGNANVTTKRFNLASLSSVRQLAEDINETEERLDILINNAGTAGLGNAFTSDGINMQMQINHFGPFLLTHLLIGLLKKSSPSRIIFVSSTNAFTSVKKFVFSKDMPFTLLSERLVYSDSKLCNIITANMLAQKLEGTGVTANSLHPGAVHTPIVTNYFGYAASYKWQVATANFIYNNFFKQFVKTPEEGAQTAIHLATAKDLTDVRGKFFMDCKPFWMPFQAKDLAYAKEVWETSEKLVNLAPEEKL